MISAEGVDACFVILYCNGALFGRMHQRKIALGRDESSTRLHIATRNMKACESDALGGCIRAKSHWVGFSILGVGERIRAWPRAGGRSLAGCIREKSHWGVMKVRPDCRTPLATRSRVRTHRIALLATGGIGYVCTSVHVARMHQLECDGRRNPNPRRSVGVSVSMRRVSVWVRKEPVCESP